MLDLHTPIKGKGIKIAFPEADEPRTLKAVRMLADQQLVKPVLIGAHSAVLAAAHKAGVALDGIEIIEVQPLQYAKDLFELRKDKGLTEDEAVKLLADPMYYATMLLRDGVVSGVVSGAVHPTAHTLRPALQIIKTRDDTPLASSFFIMETNKGLFFFADCALNIELTADELAAVGVATAKTAKRFGVEPRVAFLSFSTKGSGKHERAEKVARATKLAQQGLPGIAIDGEMQVDAATDETVGKLKAPDSPVAGHANVFIFPNLESGNIGYKLVQRFSGAKAIGPIVQGLRKPINDLSRGCTADEIVEVACVTAIQSQQG
jgi:phosphate acetyltransferase